MSQTETTRSSGTKSKWACWKWQEITRADAQPYLTRLILLRCPWFAVYLHWFTGSDDLCLHDHPWRFLSVILRGGYWETTPQGTRWYGPGSVLARPATWRHRVDVPTNKQAMTLVVSGGPLRRWGFWTPFGWIHWMKYHYAEHCP